MFSGDIGFTTTSTSEGWLLAIRDGGGVVVFGNDRIDWQDVGAPFGFGYAFWNERALTGSQVDDLIAGNWYLVMSDNNFPNGEIRGQIQLVPEPSTLALFGLGVGACGGGASGDVLKCEIALAAVTSHGTSNRKRVTGLQDD